MRFLVISDLHYGVEFQKPCIKRFIKQAIEDESVDFSLVTGDLTEEGLNGKEYCKWLECIIGSNNFLVGGGKQNQLQMLMDNFVTPIDQSNKPLYMIQGNHDKYMGASKYPVRDYLKERYGNTYYSFIIERTMFLMCDVYPTRSISDWIEKTLNATKLPSIIAFHYNLEGPMSDSWNDTDKTYFSNKIKSHNIMAIFVGHLHSSSVSTWNGIPIINTAGNQYAMIDIKDKKLTLNWVE